MIQLQQHVVAIFTAAAAFKNFQDHGAGHHVAASQVFGVGRIALHKALAVLIDQVAALAPTAFGDQSTRTVNAGGVELPHFNILNREPSTQGHTDTIAGIDMRIGGGSVNAPGTAGGHYGSFGAHIDGFTVFYINGDYAYDGAVLVFHQVNGKDRKSTRLNSSHVAISYAVFCV